MGVLTTIGDGFKDAFLMAWEVWWALVLGFAISAIVQAWVPRERIERALSGDGAGLLARATGLGAASSSCSYAAIAIAIIRRFRALDMPLQEIHAVIATRDPATRSGLIAGHLQRLETTLARTQQAAASLRDLLEPPIDATPVTIEQRRIPATPAAAVSEVIDVKDATGWYQGALGELHALLAAQKISPSGPGGAIYANDLFTHGRGEATVFVPCDRTVRATGRVDAIVVPEVDLALTTHSGPHDGEIDRAYGALATHVTDH